MPGAGHAAADITPVFDAVTDGLTVITSNIIDFILHFGQNQNNFIPYPAQAQVRALAHDCSSQFPSHHNRLLTAVAAR